MYTMNCVRHMTPLFVLFKSSYNTGYVISSGAGANFIDNTIERKNRYNSSINCSLDNIFKFPRLNHRWNDNYSSKISEIFWKISETRIILYMLSIYPVCKKRSWALNNSAPILLTPQNLLTPQRSTGFYRVPVKIDKNTFFDEV